MSNLLGLVLVRQVAPFGNSDSVLDFQRVKMRMR